MRAGSKRHLLLHLSSVSACGRGRHRFSVVGGVSATGVGVSLPVSFNIYRGKGDICRLLS